jgi:hypothetical protein
MKMNVYAIVFVLLFVNTNFVANYNQKCTEIIAQKNTLSATEILDKNYLFNVLIQDIFPEWMDTPWDFNGISNEPKSGQIACGYFVSTTLKHIGFNLNRYKTAQQAASVIIDAICGKENKKVFNSKETVLQHLTLYKNSLFVVGLDYHVGYLANIEGEVYFIHSDFFHKKVVKELATQSTGFNYTNTYHLGSLSQNLTLIKKWKSNEKVY